MAADIAAGGGHYPSADSRWIGIIRATPNMSSRRPLETKRGSPLAARRRGRGEGQANCDFFPPLIEAAGGRLPSSRGKHEQEYRRVVSLKQPKMYVSFVVIGYRS